MGVTTNDSDLLDRYARYGDEAAFRELVRRHLNLVYSSASRRVGDGHLAEDVTQAVFMILAQKTNAARRVTPLSQWLLATVRYAAANALKLDRRRRHHEGAAAASRAAGACSANPSDVLVWQEIAAELDDAVLKLSAADRTAVLLRFFEQKPISAVAHALNTTEAAAGMRVMRAVEKLRQRLNRRRPSLAAGGTVSLATVISAQALHAAPPGLFTAISAVSTGAAAGTATSFTIAKGVITMLTWTKIKGTAAVVAAAVVVTTGTVVTVTGARGGASQGESGSGIAQVLEEVPETRTPVRDSGPASSAVRERNGEEEAYRLIRALLQKPEPHPADIDAVVSRIGEVYREQLEKDGADGAPRKAEEVDEQVQRQMREWRAYINDEVRDVANSRRVVEPNEVVTVSVHDPRSGDPPERRVVVTQRLDDEGMLILEGIGKIKAAGARVGELEAKIAKAYGAAKTMKDWQEVTAELTLPRREPRAGASTRPATEHQTPHVIRWRKQLSVQGHSLVGQGKARIRTGGEPAISIESDYVTLTFPLQ